MHNYLKWPTIWDINFKTACIVFSSLSSPFVGSARQHEALSVIYSLRHTWAEQCCPHRGMQSKTPDDNSSPQQHQWLYSTNKLVQGRQKVCVVRDKNFRSQIQIMPACIPTLLVQLPWIKAGGSAPAPLPKAKSATGQPDSSLAYGTVTSHYPSVQSPIG